MGSWCDNNIMWLILKYCQIMTISKFIQTSKTMYCITKRLNPEYFELNPKTTLYLNFYEMCALGSLNVVKYLLEKDHYDKRISQYGHNPDVPDENYFDDHIVAEGFYSALYHNQLEVAKFLNTNKIKICDNSVLGRFKTLCARGPIEVIKYIVESNAVDPDFYKGGMISAYDAHQLAVYDYLATQIVEHNSGKQ